MGKIGITYSSALFQLAKEKNKLQSTYDEFKEFVNLLDKNQEVISFLKSPLIYKNEKKNFIVELLKDNSEIFINFIKVLIDKQRTHYIYDSFIEFEKLYNEYTGKVIVVVETASRLSDVQVEEIKQFVSKKYDKEAIIKEQMNKDLIMGFKIIINGEEIDMSLFGSYDRLRTILKNRIEVCGIES